MILSYKYRTYNVPLSLLRLLKRRMRYVRAAGGIVENGRGEILLIFRNGRWDLAKGKVEAGETLLQGALREVNEETGIAATPAETTPLVKTYHIFNLYGGWHLKQTSWFRMKGSGNTEPQNEEGITRCEWVDPTEAVERLGHSYGTLRTVAKKLSRNAGRQSS